MNVRQICAQHNFALTYKDQTNHAIPKAVALSVSIGSALAYVLIIWSMAS
jgi:hypothetical protein